MSRTRMMLALDTATEMTVVALASRDDDRMVMWGEARAEAPRAAMSRVLLLAEGLLNESELTMADVDEVVVGRGPGSFTGVRIGVALAKGLAHGRGIPLYGVSTLDAVAWNFRGADGDLLGVVGDAMRGEVYPALFRLDGSDIARLTPDRVAKPGDVVEQWREHAGRLVLAGNGLAKHGALFEEAFGSAAIAPSQAWAPHGGGLIGAYVMAMRDGSQGDGDPGALLPVYTRLSDAEENERARRGLPQEPPPDSGVSGGAR